MSSGCGGESSNGLQISVPYYHDIRGGLKLSSGRVTFCSVTGELEPRAVRDAARAHRRKLLRRMGLKSAELDPIASVFLDLTAKSLAKLSQLDRFYASSGGIVDESGEPARSLANYVTLLNSAMRATRMLAEHMSRQGKDGDELADYIEATYTRGNGEHAS